MNLPRGMSIVNHRLPGENFLAYRERRRFVNRIIESALKGRYATHSKDGRKYIVGPFWKHKPHEVTAESFKLSPHGVPEPHMFKVMHPGTLVKAPAK